MALGFLFMVNLAHADDRDWRHERGDVREVQHRILKEMRELRRMLEDMQKDIIDIKRMLHHRKDEMQSGSWGCSVQPPFNEPAYYGVGYSQAMATKEALEKCTLNANPKNKKYCELNRVNCREQR